MLDFRMSMLYCISIQYWVQGNPSPENPMKHWIRQLYRLFVDLREREAAQRNFMRGIYEGPSRLPMNYEHPACLRRHPLVTSC